MTCIRLLCALIWGFVFTPVFAQGVIGRIEVTGVEGEDLDTVKSLSGLLIGDDYDPKIAERGEARLKKYFENKGYPEADVDVIRSAQQVTLAVKRGNPVTVGSITLEFPKLDSRIKEILGPQILGAIDIKVDEKLDRDRIKDAKKGIESRLFAQDYIDSKVIDIDIRIDQQRTDLKFIVDVGEQIQFSVTGMTTFDRSDLIEVIENQKTEGLGRDAVSVLRSRLKGYYSDHGFRNTEIKVVTFERTSYSPKKVVFEIREGQVTRIRNVIFDGNDGLPSGQLENWFYELAADRLKARVFNETMIESAAQSVLDRIRNEGYLSAKLLAWKSEDVGNNSVDLKLFIQDGVRTRLHSLEFQGNSDVPSEKLGELMGTPLDRPLNLAKFELGLEEIKRYYRNQGYLDVTIPNESAGIIDYKESNSIADVKISVNQGPQYFLNQIRVIGNDKTRSEVILRELALNQGDPLKESLLNESEDRIRRLGIFSVVNFELVDDPDSLNFGKATKSLRITVTEATPGMIGTGLGFRNDLGLRVFSELTLGNLRGENQSFVVDVNANRRLEFYRFMEYQARASYIWPHFVLGPTTFRPSLSIERRQYIQFDAQTLALSFNFDRPIVKRWGLYFSLNQAIEQIRQFNAVDSLDNQQLRIGSLTPSLRVDRRDNPLLPRRGFYSTVSYEYSSPFLGSQLTPVPISYGRFQVRNDFHTDIVPRTVLSFSARGGYLKNFARKTLANGAQDPLVGIPLIKQFALGGINSMRGYLLQEINATDVNVQDSMSYINYRTQADFFVTPNLSIGPFLDAGNLFINYFSLGNLRYGSGVGLRYVTPVGPVNFDWGFKVPGKPGQDSHVFYFSLGVI